MMFIAAAALRFRGVVWTLPRPARHCHILHALNAVLGWNPETQSYDPLPDEERIEQGFVTDSGMFVQRETAGLMAVAAGQITALRWPPELFSEDLW